MPEERGLNEERGQPHVRERGHDRVRGLVHEHAQWRWRGKKRDGDDRREQRAAEHVPRRDERARCAPARSDSAADLRRALECVAGYVPNGQPVTRSRAAAALAEVRPNVAALREAEQARERDELLAALSSARGNLARAAALLGRSRAAVYRLLEKHGVALR